ncbi:hypothetical protein CARUB_v10017966mg [Capsella rubella]|uniref:Cyclin-dependent kinase inhibitor domain-containing protein n=1 Tax=Capsella rubella TaxID=81985 RepID=R0HHM2_9BRAS|nr:cyclin-dependent kinase inhibitor 2 [Capsella rubella]EOA24690.1 hypothetical protein CARUB_v10017966mg [Capsella rubella]
MAAVRRRERDVVEENGFTTPPTMVKRRKMMEEEEVVVDVVESSRIILSPCVQATNRGVTVARNSAGASETSVVIVRRRDSPPPPPAVEEDSSSSSVSCCSSNNNRSDKEKSKRRIEFVDVEEISGEDDQSGTSWIHDDFNKRSDSCGEESSVNMREESEEVEPRRRLKMNKLKKSCETTTTTVKETELEDFFQAAETNLRNKMLECSMKYNFDFEKDEPLGGRYDWVKLNP